MDSSAAGGTRKGPRVRDVSPDITETVAITQKRLPKSREKAVVETNVENTGEAEEPMDQDVTPDDVTPTRPRGPGRPKKGSKGATTTTAKKRGVGRPRKIKKGQKLSTEAEDDTGEKQEESILQIEKDVQGIQLSSDDLKIKVETEATFVSSSSVGESDKLNESPKFETSQSVGSIFNVKEERTFDPGFIPGLDLLSQEVTDSGDTSYEPSKEKTVSNKSSSDIVPVVEDQIFDDPDGNRIRRSSRIKSLEVQRGGRGRRREVVFSTSADSAGVKSLSNLNDEDSNSNGSSFVHSGYGEYSPGHDSMSSGVSSISLNFDSHRFGEGDDTGSNSGSPSKPLKVKSRWRYSSDAESLKSSSDSVSLEFGGTSSHDHDPDVDDSDENTPPFIPSNDLVKRPGHLLFEKTDQELIDKLKNFKGIEESMFKKERKISKESRGMVCDCFLTNEDIERGENGCVEDCLNRLLMVECGPRCPTGESCMNKKFQRKQYATLEVFKTDKKGHGLRTLNAIPEGGFVIEYVGEVLDPWQFETRTKEYAKWNQEHFYFMALKSDSIIDATAKGNCSRFINHSCEPNCETQKWTVNGELRIGFFTLRDLKPGDEIVFDYQFQRYGKKAQKCYCQTPSCRGWIGEEDEDEEADEDDKGETVDDVQESEIVSPVEAVSDEEKKPKKVRRPRKKRQDTSRILEDVALEEELTQLERIGLKNRNHTLTLSRLMVRAEKWDDRERLLNILINGDPACLRLFLDYRGLKLIYNWMINLPLPSSEPVDQVIKDEEYHILFLKALHALNIPNKTMLLDSKILTLVDTWSIAPSKTLLAIEKTEIDPSQEEILTNATESVPESSKLDCASETEAQPTLPSDPPETVPESDVAISVEQKMETTPEVSDAPVPVQENFRIWNFVDLAKSLVSSWAELKEVFRIPKKERVEQMKEHEREADKGLILSVEDSYPKSYSYDSRSKWNGRGGRERDTYSGHRQQQRAILYPYLSKEERRLMFAARVAQEEEDMKQRRMQEEIVSLHQHRCGVLGLDPCTTPVVDMSGHYFLDPKTIQWKVIEETDPTLPPGIKKLVEAARVGGENASDQQQAQIVVEEPEYVFPPWPDGLPPPPPLPPSTFPDGWKMAVDDQGRCYYYHVKTRRTQWHPPTAEDCEATITESSDSSDSEYLEEEDASDDNAQSTTPQVPVATLRTRVIERAEKRKKSGLVQVRIISPRTDDDKSNISKAVIRARKLEVLEEKRQKAAEAAFKIEETDEIDDEGSPYKETVVSAEPCDEKASPPKLPEESEVVQSISETHDDEDADPLSSPIETELDISLASITDDNLETFDSDSPSTLHNVVNIPGLGMDPRDRLPSTSSSPAIIQKKDRQSKMERKQKTVEYKKIASDKSKEAFRNQIANVVVTHLNPYRKPDCKNGRIASTEDFKHLARKMTHAILLKELKHGRDGKPLEVTDSVKHKTKEYVKKFMGRFGSSNYLPSPEDNQGK